LTRQERALENVKQEVTALQLEQQTSTGRENYAIHELKSEIISLKGLMLNRYVWLYIVITVFTMTLFHPIG
jgi:hypothetical protein